MAYQALYRRWRPRTFEAVVGQSAICDTLRNSIKRHKISHAFLFSGPRGTGKTSCAKIFAKAINCMDSKDGEPCNQCSNCLAADKGILNDIIEIDAASNNGVDEIRAIRDKVKYAPTQGYYKVYIIDEVHMLSIGAFNALLKTLEEPPEHVVFILATTELQKVPATIISRTQRYNFKRISNDQLVARMKFILDQEKIAYDEKSLQVIAQVADGGMRDSLSILDQILSYDQAKINYKDTLAITGYADQVKIEALFLDLLNKKTSQALEEVEELLNNGASAKNILDEIINLVVKAMLAIKGDTTVTFLSANYLEQLRLISTQVLSQTLQLANDALNSLRYTNQQQIPLKVFVVRISTQDVNATVSQTDAAEIKQLQTKVEQLSLQVAELLKKANTSAIAKPSEILTEIKDKVRPTKAVNPSVATLKKKKTGLQLSTEANLKKVNVVLSQATKQDLNTIKDVWQQDMSSLLEVSQRALLEVLEPVAASPTQVVLKCKYEFWFERAMADENFISQLENNLEKLTQHKYQIVLVSEKSWTTIRQEYVKKYKEHLIIAQRELASNPNEEVIKKAKSLFGDLVNVKDDSDL